MEPIVCIFSLGLELLQGRNQDASAFQRVDARPEWEGGVRAKPGGRQPLGHPQTLSALRAETFFADRKQKPAEPPPPLLYTGRGQAWRTALDT